MAYLTLLTTLGQAKLATALANGAGVSISHLAVGDGNGAAVTPQASMTALVREKYRVAVQSVAVDPLNSNYIIVEAVIPSTVGGWTIREAGLFDGDGQLFAVANFPDTVKPLLAEGSARDLVIRIVVEVSNAATVQLLIDPSVVLASQSWVLTQGFVKKAGDTMTGPLVLPGNATQNLEAVPKQQLDAATANAVSKAGDTMTGQLKLVGDPVSGLDAACKNYVDAARGVDSVPIGEVIWHAGSTAPTSFLVCDGSAVSRTTYDVLFARIGTTYGTGNGSTTFNLPDLRGEFIRGWDNRATGGVDNGRVFGSKQTATGLGHIGTDPSSNQLAMSVADPDLPNETYSFPGRQDSGQGGTATQKRWRVRPRNVAMLPCIKARLLTSVDIALMQQAQAMYLPLGGGNLTGGLNVLFGNVGIGTSAPLGKLHVEGYSYLNGPIFLGRQDATVEGGQITFARSTDNAAAWSIDVNGGDSAPRLRFFTSDEKMSILTSGNVGIGTITPTQKLEVSGNIKASGSVSVGANATGALEVVPKQQLDSEVAALSSSLSFTGANQSLGVSGYQKLPGGLIIQWGYYSATSTVNPSLGINVNFPIAFPNACRSLKATYQVASGGYSAMAVGVPTTTRGTYYYAGTPDTLSFFWLAIGY